jgi:hypothetical protein
MEIEALESTYLSIFSAKINYILKDQAIMLTEAGYINVNIIIPLQTQLYK